MSGRSAENKKPTDQQCPHCDLWFDPRGIQSHEPFCPERDDPEGTDDGASQQQQQQEQQQKQPDGAPGGDPESPPPDTLVCPTCGNQDNGDTPRIFITPSTLQVLAGSDAVELTPAAVQQLQNYEYLCESCNAVFNS